MKKRFLYFWSILVILLINVLAISIVRNLGGSAETLSKYGSQGSEVRQIQTRLKNWGYYQGSVDGVYGTATKNAVVYFQKKNGLSADGVAGTATLKALGISSSSSSSGGSGGGAGGYSSSDVNLLARVISAEARGEPYVGQVAVGAVILLSLIHI